MSVLSFPGVLGDSLMEHLLCVLSHLPFQLDKKPWIKYHDVQLISEALVMSGSVSYMQKVFNNYSFH